MRDRRGSQDPHRDQREAPERAVADPGVLSELALHEPQAARHVRGSAGVNGETGEFGEINLRRDEPQDPVLRFCVIGVLAKLKLDKPPGSRIVLESVPIKFEWSNP